MKRIIIIAATALLAQAAVFAQIFDEPSEQSVLEAARQKYWNSAPAAPTAPDAPEAPDIPRAPSIPRPPAIPRFGSTQEDAPYTPFLISIVPGVNIPFGVWSASFAGGPIGIIMGDVHGAAAAGVFTMTRDVRGFQAAGVFNMSRGVSGFQSAGVFNIVDRDLSGAQGAGVFNIVNGRMHGAQGAGVFNIAQDVIAPVQAAGVFNIAEDIKSPLQAAGVFNIAESVSGFQVAGLFNVAGDVRGGQLAPIVNVAEDVNGVQIGLVNVAEDLHGVQLGLVNIARNGVNCLGVLYEPDTGYAYGLWQAGSRALYTIATVGAPRDDWFVRDGAFIASFGLGSRTRLFGLNFDLDLSAVQPVENRAAELRAAIESGTCPDWSGLDPYPSARLTIGVPILGKIQVVCGVKLDAQLDVGGEIPESQRVGRSWSGNVFGLGYTAYSKVFAGVKF